MTRGSTIIVGRKFSTKTFWPDVRQYKATIVQYVGETCRYLVAAPPQKGPNGENLDTQNDVRIAFGNGMRPDVWDKFKDRFDIPTIAEFYAATEGTSGSWNLSRNDYTRGAIGKNGAMAKAILGKQIIIVEVDWNTDSPKRNADGFCIPCLPGDQGELLFKLDETDIKKTFQGYYGNEKASDGKVLRNVQTKGDAFFRTGDVIR
jgi:acyl-CoA synthetase (AMP-forming)/AMP-acid ligase II